MTIFRSLCLLLVSTSCGHSQTSIDSPKNSITADARAATTELYALNVDGMRSLLAEHPDLRTVDEFLSLLPTEFRNRFVLVFDSKGAQAACSSLDNPRIVFQTDDGHLLMAVSNPNGNPDCHAEVLEMIMF